MEIVKELNLNGNPQTVTNGSLVFAKNIKLSDDGTYITNDDGFAIAFIETEPAASELKVANVVGTFCKDIYDPELYVDQQNLVGYINCPNEIVLFVDKHWITYDEETNEPTRHQTSEIYRAVELKNNSDKLALYKIDTGWEYDNGKIVGTYNYNINNHLIIAIAESEAYKIELSLDEETFDVIETEVPFDKQLMTIDLNYCSDEDDLNNYSCAPDIPICNLRLLDKIKGNAMPRGIYNFFVRYEISDNIYTNWFPIGIPQYALSLEDKTIFAHIYDVDGVKNTNASCVINANKDSFYNFSFSIEFNHKYNYKGYQIGYILQTEDTAVARVWKSFSFDNGLSISFTFNGGFIEEGSIEDFSRNVLNLYNVKVLANYNNRLYIANFKETDYNINNEEIQECVNKIKAHQVKRVFDTATVEESGSEMTTWTYHIHGITASVTLPSNITSIPIQQVPAIRDLIAGQMDYSKGSSAEFIANETRDLVLTTDGIKLNPAKVGEWYSGPYGSDTPLSHKTPFYWKKHELFGGYYGILRNVTPNDVFVTKSETKVNYNTYNKDTTIRTLMPYEVYAFFVHYVRPDGSFTNGYQLNNTPKQEDAILDKTLSELDNVTLQSLGLDKLATFDELKNRYAYELYYNRNNIIINNGVIIEDFVPYLAENGKRLFKTGKGKYIDNNFNYKLLSIGVEFYDITYPKGFVGCFFSYEKVKHSSYQTVVTDILGSNNNILCKANEVEAINDSYSGTIFIPSHRIDPDTGDILPDYEEDAQHQVIFSPNYAYINGATPIISNSVTSFLNNSTINRIGTHGGIVMNLNKDSTTGYEPFKYLVGDVIHLDRSIYTSDNKELIPFGPVTNGNRYGEVKNPNGDDYNVVHQDMNYPSFLVEDKILIYKEHIKLTETLAPKIITNSIETNTFYSSDNYAKIINVWKYSNYNLSALSIKKEPENRAGVVQNNNVSINILVEPINASDLFKLESCYIPQIHKAYTEYNKNLESQTTITNVVRTTYPIRNESITNSWKYIDPLAYHVINNANGEIINIFGAGSAFYIHTKNNLLTTTSNAKLDANNIEINIVDNDIFDIEPKELFTSDLGYGGLKYQDCQLFSQFGYIWYDSERYKLFRFDNGHLVDISSGIDELLKYYRFEKCYINIDNENNRIFFAFEKVDRTGVTLGYDTLTNKWLSLYDFTFNRAMHTANYAVFGIDTSTSIYKYSKDAIKCDYRELYNVNLYFPRYNYIPYAKYCCFDVIFNEAYSTPKSLTSISWIHEIIKRHTLDGDHPAELEIVDKNIDDRIKDLDLVYIDIYTDSTDSGLLDIKPSKLNDVANPSNLDAHKYPYYNKGVWNFSYFRNNVNIPINETELQKLAEKYNLPIEKLKNVYKIADKDGNIIYRSSDLRSLIYGKYIVVRFVFKCNKKIKFDNLTFNVNKY